MEYYLIIKCLFDQMAIFKRARPALLYGVGCQATKRQETKQMWLRSDMQGQVTRKDRDREGYMR